MIKNAGPLRLGAGRLLAFLGAGDARREGRRRGDGLPGMAGAGNGPAAICGGNSAVFNQLLTIFLVVAMVWRLPVFFLCSYCLFWRRLGRFRLPGAGVEVGGPVVVLGVNCLPEPSREGVAEKGWGSSWDGGRFIPPHPPHPSTDFGVAENRPGGFLQSGPEII